MKNYVKKFSIMFVMSLILILGCSVSAYAATKWDTSTKAKQFTLSTDSLTVTLSPIVGMIRADRGVTSGKWYWEYTMGDTSPASWGSRSAAMFGICDSTYTNNPFDDKSKSLRAYYPLGTTTIPELFFTKYAPQYGDSKATEGTVISVLLDMDAKTLEFWSDGVSQGISHKDLDKLSKEVFPALAIQSGSMTSTVTANFGLKPFKYAVPAGYLPYDSSSSIVLNKTMLDLPVGNFEQLTATTTPSDAEIVWTSSDTAIATVDSNGKVTGIKEGQATITAQIKDSETKDTCVVTVVREGTNPPVDEPTTGDGTLYIEMVDGNIKQAQDVDVADFIKWFKNRDLDNNDNPIYKIKNAKGNVEYLVHDKVVAFEIR